MMEESNKKQQFFRKSIILSFGLLFVICGLLIIYFFVSFIENDFKNKCLISIESSSSNDTKITSYINNTE